MTDNATLRVIILGATSAIAGATARLYAEEARASLLLVGRNEERLADMKADLLGRGAARVETVVCDLSQPVDASAQFATFANRLGGVDHVILAYGVLGEQGDAEADWRAAEAILRVNFTSAAAWALSAGRTLEGQGHGSLVVFGSVAGDRGRRNNFIYGAAKAGIATLVEGIAHRFAGRGPRAVLLKIGPTISPMTAHMNRTGRLWARPEQIARIACRAARRGPTVVYAPGFWRFIMVVIRNLPDVVFNRLNI